MQKKIKIEVILPSENMKEALMIAEYLESLEPAELKEFSIFVEGAKYGSKAQQEKPAS